MAEKFSDSTIEKIIIGVAIGSIVGLLGYIGGRITAPQVPPIADISPKEVNVEAGTAVKFTAIGSSDAKNSITEYIWSIGGHPLGMSTLGQCSLGDKPSDMNCIFVVPGTFSVSVEVKNSINKSNIAIASVNVTMKNGYIGLYLKIGADQTEKDEAYRSLLDSINWSDVQRFVPRPIIIYDPDLKKPVYAASVRTKKVDLSSTGKLGPLAGSRLLIPNLDPRALDIIKAAVERQGGEITIMPISNITPALTAGLSNSGFLPVSSLEEYESKFKKY